MTTKVALDHPFKEWREDQVNAIDQCVQAARRGYKFIILEGPCGTGKSSVAVELLRRLGGGRILTSQVLLQQQYHNDYPEFRVLKGSGRYSCHMRGPSTTIGGVGGSGLPTQYEKLDNIGRTPTCGRAKWFHRPTATFVRCTQCPYTDALQDVTKASYSILNYHAYYYQNRVRDDIFKGTNLILDEAHNLNSVTTDLFTRTFKEFAGFTFPKFTEDDCYRPPYKGTADLVNKDYVERVLEDYKEHLLKRKVICEMRKSSEAYKEREWINEKLSHVTFHLKYVHKTAFTYTMKEDGWNYQMVVKPIDASKLVNTCFYEGNNTVIFMSATILDKEVFCKEVGINPDKAFHYQMQDVFDPGKHTIRFVPKPQNMQLKSRRDSMSKLLPVIQAILAKHGNEKGIIHAQTHSICKSIVDGLKDPRLTYFLNRETCLDEHARKGKSVIVSPSMKEGLDLKGDESTFQILVVVPYPMFDYHTVNKMKVNGKYYQWATAVDFVQSLGRSVRSTSDTCTTYLLDSRFYTLINSMEDKFSQYLLDTLPFEMEKISV